MKFGLLKAITVTLFGLSFIVSAPAFAGKNHHGNGHSYGYGNSHYKNQSYGNHRRSPHNAGPIIGGIIGGVILGTIIHNASSPTKTYSNYNNERQYYQYNSPVVIQSTPVTTYRVLNGSECYLVNINQHGNEILTQVPNLNCGF
jgi:hypothetical protein